MDVARVSNYQAPPPPMPGQGGVDVPTPMPVQSSAPPPQEVPAIAEVRSMERVSDVGDPLQRAVSEINVSIASHGRHLSIRVHEATGRRMVTVYNSETNDVVREIPPERVLDAHANMLELAGLFMDTRG
jgi:uncharacterized FlaG/YvyC family protein